MDEKTLEALKGSIRKWEAIVEGTGIDDGSENCPLCQLFLNDNDVQCCGCPVSIHTQNIICAGTPYYNYCAGPTTENAQAELNFLKSLLPPWGGERSQTAFSEDRTGHSDSAQTTKA